MTYQELVYQIKSKGSYLCVGLDTDPDKLPLGLKGTKEGLLRFNRAIIDATKDHCVAYKPNIAFYESLGAEGWDLLQETLSYIPKSHFTIADAKRGDIGNTSRMYAKTFFQTYPFDSITVAPYMGKDSVEPFLNWENKWTILLALTSNPGADDFEQLHLTTGKQVFEEVLEKAASWAGPERLMFVCGATRPEALKQIRTIVPNHFFLIPGVGAQGGDLKEVSRAAMNKDVGILVNASRSILFASSGADYAEAAAREAEQMHKEMRELILSI